MGVPSDGIAPLFFQLMAGLPPAYVPATPPPMTAATTNAGARNPRRRLRHNHGRSGHGEERRPARAPQPSGAHARPRRRHRRASAVAVPVALSSPAADAPHPSDISLGVPRPPRPDERTGEMLTCPPPASKPLPGSFETPTSVGHPSLQTIRSHVAAPLGIPTLTTSSVTMSAGNESCFSDEAMCGETRTKCIPRR
jgi:hypothetical protein